MELLDTAPGFIRSFGFGDGPHIALLVFWRTAGEAKIFAARPEYRQAMRDLYQHHWQYSHFPAIWEMTTNHDRIIFCPDCSVALPAGEPHCKGSGTEVFDPYRTDSR